jgi:hypothetical protein
LIMHLVRILYPGYCGLPITAQQSEYNRFSPMTNG